MSDSDSAATYERLKAETAGMLNLSVASSSLLENLQIDLVSLLRLEVDTLQGQVLAGDSVDLKRLETALDMLQKLLPAQALVAPAPAPARRFDGNARERLKAMIEKTVMNDDSYARNMAVDPNKARADFEAQLQEAIEKYPNAFPPPPPDAASADSPAPIEPAPPEPAPQPPRLTDVESMNATNQRARESIERSGYLQDEPSWMRTWKRSPWSM
jgi:hypothetical protein